MRRSAKLLTAFAALALLAGPALADDDGDKKEGSSRPSPGDFAKRIMENDKNKDGKLSKDEIPERMRPMLSRIDKNDDGEIDKKEVDAMVARFREMRERYQGRGRPGSSSDRERSGRPGPPQRRGPPRRPGGDNAERRGPPHRGPRPGSGFRPDPDEIFKRMDADGDGSVSKDEFKKAHERMRKMRASHGGPGHGPPRSHGRSGHDRHHSAHRGHHAGGCPHCGRMGPGHHHRGHHGHRGGWHGKDRDGHHHKHGDKDGKKTTDADKGSDESKAAETESAADDRVTAA